MITPEAALARILALADPLPSETIPLRAASGRYLTQTSSALRDQPPFDASQMDGYALADDQLAAGQSFDVVAEIAAGHRWDGILQKGQAARIFTGARVPAGAKRVVIQEDVIRDGDTITLKDGMDTDLYIRRQGSDFAIGHQVAPKRLRPYDLALLAAMNCAQVGVARRPVVAILSTGDELVWPGQKPSPDQIIAASPYALAALCEEEGADVRILPLAADRFGTLEACLKLAQGADLVLTTGGASVGAHDIVADVAKHLGMELDFWKIAMRPGKPLIAGRLQGAVFLGLPGNPVATMVCADLFVRPLLRRLQGLETSACPQVPRIGRLSTALPKNGPRAQYHRATLSYDKDGTALLTPFAQQDSAHLRILSLSDALVIQPAHDDAKAAGDPIGYLPLGQR